MSTSLVERPWLTSQYLRVRRLCHSVQLNDITLVSSSPLKLTSIRRRRPVISTPLPLLSHLDRIMSFAETSDEWIAAIEKEIRQTTERIEERQARAREIPGSSAWHSSPQMLADLDRHQSRGGWPPTTVTSPVRAVSVRAAQSASAPEDTCAQWALLNNKILMGYRRGSISLVKRSPASAR